MTTEKKKGRWKPGESGNPAGRKPGSGQVAQLREHIAKAVPSIINVLVERAQMGDVQACRLLLERVLPAMKPVEQPVPLQLPDDGLVSQGYAIIRAVSEGTLAPGQAGMLMTGLGTLARLVETEDFERRLEALERASEVRE